MWVDHAKKEGKLQEGIKVGMISIDGKRVIQKLLSSKKEGNVLWKYVGDLDVQTDKFCGYGALTYTNGAMRGYYNYTGTFYNGKFHGIGIQYWKDFIYEGEFTDGRRHGKATHYMKNGQVLNVTYTNGTQNGST